MAGEGYVWRCRECGGAECVARVMSERTVRQRRREREDVHEVEGGQAWVEITCAACLAFEQEWSAAGVEFWRAMVEEAGDGS